MLASASRCSRWRPVAQQLPHQPERLRRACPAAGAARRGAAVLLHPDQPPVARHPAAARAEERERRVQPDPQPRRCRGPGPPQHPDPPSRAAALEPARRPGSTRPAPRSQATLDTLAARFSPSCPVDAELAALRQLARIVQREAQVLTFNDAFLGLALLYVAALAPLAAPAEAAGARGGPAEPVGTPASARAPGPVFHGGMDEQAARLSARSCPFGAPPLSWSALLKAPGALAGMSLLGSVPAFVVLAALLAVGVVGSRTLVVGWLASVLVRGSSLHVAAA